MTETWTTRPIDPPDAKRVREVWSGGNEHHTLAIAEYLFESGHTALYVEASESHDGAHETRVTALSEAVHLLQNATAGELFAIGNRAAERRAEDAERKLAELREAAVFAADPSCRECLGHGLLNCNGMHLRCGSCRLAWEHRLRRAAVSAKRQAETRAAPTETPDVRCAREVLERVAQTVSVMARSIHEMSETDDDTRRCLTHKDMRRTRARAFEEVAEDLRYWAQKAHKLVGSPPPHVHPRDEAPVLAHEASGAVGDEEREAQSGPRGDEVG